MHIAISGAGVAGPTLAYWLRRSGHEISLIEQAPQLRAGGYVIDFWGLGYQLAERMGVLREVLAAGYQVQEVRMVDRRGRRIAGFSAEGEASKITRGVPTVGRIANGGVVEREIDFALNKLQTLRLSLRNPDLTTARRVAAAINDFIGGDSAEPTDPSTVALQIPPRFKGNMIKLLTDIEQLRVEPDQLARVVIDERSGIIVMGKDVRVSTVAVAQGNLTVTISEQPQVSQPEPFSRGQTVVTPRTSVKVDTEGGNKLALVKESVTLAELVDGLNALGIGPRDLISILQAIKSAGALQAEIEVM